MHRALVDVSVVQKIQERCNSGRDSVVDDATDLAGRRRLCGRLRLESLRWRYWRRRRCSLSSALLRVRFDARDLRRFFGGKVVA